MQSEQTAERLRFAVASGRFGDIETLLDRYKLDVEADWKTASPGERQEIAQRTMTLLRWAQRTMLASRAHAQMRHQESSRRMAYADNAPKRSAVSING